jgi:hypothetical protein
MRGISTHPSGVSTTQVSPSQRSITHSGGLGWSKAINSSKIIFLFSLNKVVGSRTHIVPHKLYFGVESSANVVNNKIAVLHLNEKSILINVLNDAPAVTPTSKGFPAPVNLYFIALFKNH